MSANRPAFLISASRLSDAGVVYLTSDRRWSERFEDGAQYEGTADGVTARDEALARAKADEAQVCNAYVVELTIATDGSVILSTRERLRREGATRVRERLGHAT